MIEPEVIHTAFCPFQLNHVDIHLARNFLEPQDFELMKEYIINYVNLSLTNQNFDRKTMFDENGKEVPLIGYYRNRPFRKVWHLGHVPGYWQQSKATITDFAMKALPEILHPIMYKYVMKCKNELSLFQGDWLPTRCIINTLMQGQTLDGHCDGNFLEIDVEKPAPTVSATIYIRLPQQGGFLWFADGFVSHPVENSVAIFNGQDVYHGISAVIDSDPNFVRLAFTTRWCRVQDMLFPSDAPMLYPPSPLHDGY